MDVRLWNNVKLYPLLLSCFATLVFSARRPLEVQWSKNTYGPDGPWNAVKVYVGSHEQELDLIPGAAWWSNALSADFCSYATDEECYAREAGLYDPSLSQTSVNTKDDTSPPDFGGSNLQMTGKSMGWLDTLAFTKGADTSHVVQNCSLNVADEAVVQFPSGRRHSVRIGQLSIGGTGEHMVIDAGYKGGVFDGGMPPTTLHKQGAIPSPSFGLHVGSPRAGIPGSLVLGGYDPGRVADRMGVFSMQTVPPIFGLPLSGIAITSTPNITNDNILKEALPNYPTHLQVSIASGSPYLALPPAVCKAMTENLPVSFSSALGYYLWNTDDPMYEKLVNSASYYTFTFYINFAAPVHVRVPFKLMDLTLEPPVVQKPTKYFPCVPQYVDENYGLGHAFLQAAFYGINWGPLTYPNRYLHSEIYLAQAPGPDLLSPRVAPIPATNSLEAAGAGSYNLWVDSWALHWNNLVPKPTKDSVVKGGLPADGGGGQTLVNPPGNGLSTAATAGIGVAVALGVLILVCGALSAFFFVRRRRRRRSKEQTSVNGVSTEGTLTDVSPPSSVTEIEAMEAKIYEKDAPVKKLELEDQGPLPELEDLGTLDENDTGPYAGATLINMEPCELESPMDIRGPISPIVDR